MRNRVLEAFAAALLEDDPQALYDRAPCGYLSTAADGTVLKTNVTFRTMTGHPVEHLVGRSFASLLTVGGRAFFETHLAPLLQLRDHVGELTVDLQCADGSVLPVMLNARLDRDEEGRPVVVRYAVFDATERRRYERDLRRSVEEARSAQQEAERAERSTRRLVETLQESLVPRTLPTIEGLELGATYRPAGDGSEVGGDFYDVFTVDGDCWVVLGDVSGKGVGAAVVTALVRNGAWVLMTTLPPEQREPAELLRRLDQLVDEHETTHFATAAVLRLRPAAPSPGGTGWEVAYASAGHPPLLLRRGTGPAEPVVLDGRPLGMGVGTAAEQRTLRVATGDALLLYTDGISEARDDGRRLFGEERLCATLGRLRTSAAQETADAILAEVLRFENGAAHDDVACLALVVR